MRVLVRFLLWSLLAVFVLAGALALWASSEGSVAQALRLGAAWLPQGQKLSVQNASGSLVHGQVAQWRWQQDQLDVEGQQLQWRINTDALWSGQLHVPELSLQTLTLRDERPSQPLTPPTNLELPLPIKVQLHLGSVASTGSVKWQAREIDAQYTYNGHAHQLQLQQLQWAQGLYSGQLQLQAQAPWALQAQLQASVAGPGPTPLQLQASAHGQLAGAQARIDVQAQLHTEVQSKLPPQLKLNAQLYPWQNLSRQSAQAQWHALDPALLWPQAPHTVLDGELHMRAVEQAQGQQSNWQLDLNTRVGPGSVQAQATQTTQGWQGHLKLNQVRSADVYTSIPDTLWSGRVRFESTDRVIDFQTDLQGQERGGAVAHVRSQGQWSGKLMQLDSLDVRWAGLKAQGQLKAQLDSPHLQGHLQWQWPGMQGQWQGDLQAERGQG
ncbi:MAG: Translocation and assembly module TamB, partial [Pseudomonadota bacterium]